MLLAAFATLEVANGLVYAGSLDSKIYAFDAATGQQKWAVPVGSNIPSSPTVQMA
ncbi:MAG TPA: PQQ-binding-like beta-propeller repeat protein [Ktedonobacteraceae bacterium]|nr:PQQ-binding-like beta-propeller repeat protein [Ktedonobacteraceae bacterium]